MEKATHGQVLEMRTVPHFPVLRKEYFGLDRQSNSSLHAESRHTQSSANKCKLHNDALTKKTNAYIATNGYQRMKVYIICSNPAFQATASTF